MLKKCNNCGVEKPQFDFYPHKGAADGLRGNCKSCHKARSAANYFQNVEKSRQNHRDYYKRRLLKNPNFQKDEYWKNPEKRREQGRAAYSKHREKRLVAVKEYSRKNRGKSNAIKKMYKLAKSRACPSWVKDCFGMRVKIENIYNRAKTLSETTGILHHVDHIIPLRGENVSGLHVPWNLQILTAEENMRKSNRVLT